MNKIFIDTNIWLDYYRSNANSELVTFLVALKQKSIFSFHRAINLFYEIINPKKFDYHINLFRVMFEY